jgi:hypothetical protein
MRPAVAGDEDASHAWPESIQKSCSFYQAA